MLAWWNNQGGVYLGGVALAAVLAVLVSFVVGAAGGSQSAGQSALLTGAVAGASTAAVMRPLATRRIGRVTTLLARTWRRVAIVSLALATAGFVGLLPGLSALAVVGTGLALGVALPTFLWATTRRATPGRTLVVGDDPSQFPAIQRSLPVEPIGVVSPTLAAWTGRLEADAPDGEAAAPERRAVADGGAVTDGGHPGGLERLGGLSRLEHVLDRHDVDTVALAFAEGDREEFFGVLETCHDQGLEVLVHESLSDRVLAGETYGSSLVRVDLEPIPWYSRVAKRAFDIVFAIVGLVVLAPLIALISIAIRLDSPGPILYSQTRTSELGNEFTVSKFRSMVTDAEAETGATLSDEDAGDVDPRVTRVGRILRKTHMDEIPQLVAVLRGDMSAVGPRPERPELDREIQSEGVDWPKRWFVKPGLTGISQVNGVTGFDPDQKLAYDLEYARRQSLWLDTKLVVMQVLTVIEDAYGMVFGTPADDPESAGRSDGAEQDGDVVDMTEKPPAAEASANDD